MYENLVDIQASVHAATSAEFRQQKQEVDFSIGTSRYPITNPFGDLKVKILQNFRWDNALDNLKPIFIKDDLLDYNYDEENTFNGGNEFRRFDIRSLKYETEFVQRIVMHDDGTDVYLMPDKVRYYTRYSSDNDINGKFEIKTTAAVTPTEMLIMPKCTFSSITKIPFRMETFTLQATLPTGSITTTP